MNTLQLNIENSLPHDWQRATLVGRVWLPGERGGPAVVVIRDGEVIDCSAHFATLSLLLDHVPGREGQAVADPYFGDDDGFETTWAEVTAATWSPVRAAAWAVVRA